MDVESYGLRLHKKSDKRFELASLKLTPSTHPENWWLGDKPFLLGPGPFQGLCGEGNGCGKLWVSMAKNKK